MSCYGQEYGYDDQFHEEETPEQWDEALALDKADETWEEYWEDFGVVGIYRETHSIVPSF